MSALEMAKGLTAKLGDLVYASNQVPVSEYGGSLGKAPAVMAPPPPPPQLVLYPKESEI